MCDIQCTVGLGLTGGLIVLMMSIVFCKIICLDIPEVEQPVATIPTVIDMPITIRIYLPQQDKQTS
jgi:hypothetical protein